MERLTMLDLSSFLHEWRQLSRSLPKPLLVKVWCWLVGHHMVSCTKTDWQYCGRCGKLFLVKKERKVEKI